MAFSARCRSALIIHISIIRRCRSTSCARPKSKSRTLTFTRRTKRNLWRRSSTSSVCRRSIAIFLSRAEREIHEFIDQRKIDICAIIIEPIQGEGGDNHFRSEWLQTLRKICDENEMLLIFDEVQCGMGATGRNWCCEHFNVLPDLLAFGKKAQVCGVMAGPRLDEVKDNAFRLPSRLNSTWGGNFTDMVRSTHYLRIIEEEHLVENATKVGGYFLDRLRDLTRGKALISAARGRGLFLAFDLPDAKTREEFWHGFFDLGVLTLRSGENSIRFRPTLDLTAEVVDEAIDVMRKFCRQRRKQ